MKNIFAPFISVPLVVGDVKATWNKAANEVTVSYRVFQSDGFRELYINIKKPGGALMRVGPFSLDMVNPNRQYTRTIKLY